METECLKRRRLKGGGHYFSTAIRMKKRDFHWSGQCCTGLFCLAAFVGRVHSLAFCWPVVCVVRSVRRPTENSGEVHWRAFRTATARSSSMKSRPVVLLNFVGQTTAHYHSHGRTGQHFPLFSLNLHFGAKNE